MQVSKQIFNRCVDLMVKTKRMLENYGSVFENCVGPEPFAPYTFKANPVFILFWFFGENDLFIDFLTTLSEKEAVLVKAFALGFKAHSSKKIRKEIETGLLSVYKYTTQSCWQKSFSLSFFFSCFFCVPHVSKNFPLLYHFPYFVNKWLDMEIKRATSSMESGE